MSRRILFASLISLVAALTSPWSMSAESSPSDIASAYFTALGKGDWQASTALMHPDALDRFKGIIATATKGKDGKELLQQLFQVSTQKDFDRLSNAETFRLFWSSMARLQPDLVKAFGMAQQAILGSVAEGENIVHVVSKVTIRPEPGVSASQIDVVSLQRDGASWRVLLTGDMEGLAEELAGE